MGKIVAVSDEVEQGRAQGSVAEWRRLFPAGTQRGRGGYSRLAPSVADILLCYTVFLHSAKGTETLSFLTESQLSKASLLKPKWKSFGFWHLQHILEDKR